MRDKLYVGPGTIVGSIILVVGIVLLLDRQGLVDAGYLLSFFWPAVFLVAGIAKLIQAPERPGSRAWGAILTSAGVLLFLNKLGYLPLHGRDLWPLALIAVGVLLLWGTLGRRAGPPAFDNPTLSKWTIFGGGEITVDTKDFQGGELFAMFGGYDVDLRDAGMKANEATLHANALFGGIEIKVPDSWSVVLEGTAILGGYSDKSRHPKFDDESQVKRLRIRGMAMFGGVDVHN